MRIQFKPDSAGQFATARAGDLRRPALPLWIVTALLSWARRAVERRRARAAVHALDDRMLRDIGVSRWEIEHTMRDGSRRSERD